MKKLVLVICTFALLFPLSTFAQNNQGKADDAGRIAITPQVNDQTIPQGAKNLLLNKMKQICTKNGMSGDGENPFFIMDASIDVLSKELTSTAPPMHALNMQINFFIKDASGAIFGQTSYEAKGVGQNETKAYMAGIKNINVNSGQFKSMVEQGKAKILEFYNSQCDFIISKAKALQKQGSNGEAIKVLKSVPPVCKECYDMCMDVMSEIEPPAEVPAQAAAPADNNNQSSATGSGNEQLITEQVYLVYMGGRYVGDKTVLNFEFQNRGTDDFELNDYALDTRAIDLSGKEYNVETVTVAGKSGSRSVATVMNGTPVPMDCEFAKMNGVSMFEYKYDNKVYRFKDLAVSGSSAAPPTQQITPVATQPAAAPAPAQPSPMLVGDVVLASFNKDNDFYHKRYLPAKIQTLPSAATKGETQLIVINDETPSNTWTTDLLTKWHMVSSSELHDGSVVIYTDDDTPDIKSVYYPGVVVMSDELYKGIVSIKGRWGDINKINVKSIAIVDIPALSAP